MKANKIFAAALAALTFIALTACGTDEPTNLELSETSISLKAGETHQLTANVKVESWTTSNAAVATVADGLVTAVAEGNAIISATANGVTKTCVVLVAAKEDETTKAEVKGSKIWPVILDAVTAESVTSKIVGDFRVDDVNNFLYIWSAGETYAANDNPTGLNFYGNQEGYLSLTVVGGSITWSGLGYCLTAKGDNPRWEAAEALRAAIVANPDNYFLHIAIKSTDNGNHQFYTFNDKSTSFAIGSATIEQGEVIGNYTRDGSWAEFDIPMSNFSSALSALTFPAGGNIFCVLSGSNAGTQLNLDAVYFYEK